MSATPCRLPSTEPKVKNIMTTPRFVKPKLLQVRATILRQGSYVSHACLQHPAPPDKACLLSYASAFLGAWLPRKPPPPPASRLHIWITDLVSRYMITLWQLPGSCDLYPPSCCLPWLLDLHPPNTPGLCTRYRACQILPSSKAGSRPSPGTIPVPHVSKSRASRTSEFFVILTTCKHILWCIKPLCVHRVQIV